MSKQQRTTAAKIFNFISNLMFAVLLAALATGVYYKVTHKTPSFFGYTFSVVLTSSMDGTEAPVIKEGDFIIVKNTKIENINVGDTVLYNTHLPENLSKGINRIIHKVTAVNTDGDGDIYLTTKGTANKDADRESVTDVIGVYKGKSAILGKFVLFFRNPVNIAFTVIVLTGVYISLKILINIFLTVKDRQ